MRALVLAVTLVAIPAAARADGAVTVTLTEDGEALAAALGVTPDELAARAEARIDEAYYVTRTDELLRAFADASAFSGHGLGVDYGSNPDGLMLGVAANIAVAVGDLGAGEAEAEHPVAGVAANLSLMGGINLARFGHPAFTAYGNAFHRTGSYEQLRGSISTMGVHLQYRMTRPDEDLGSLVLQWGGLAFTAGLQAGRWSFGLTDTIENDFEVAGTDGATSVHMASEGDLELETFSITAPVEVSTSLRVLYVVSVYVGAGLDLQRGSSRLDAELDGVLTADRGDGTISEVGTARLTIDGESRPSRGMLREMVGVQVNAWKLKAFVQLNAMLVRAASVAVGLRIVL